MKIAAHVEAAVQYPNRGRIGYRIVGPDPIKQGHIEVMPPHEGHTLIKASTHDGGGKAFVTLDAHETLALCQALADNLGYKLWPRTS